jgi:hypothetical protein
VSQLAALRPQPRPTARRPGATPRQLKVVAPPEIQGNGAFLGLCILLLFGGFVGVLVLNTAMAKGSYTMRDLQQRSDELADSQDSLRHSIDKVSGPGPLAQRARSLGMVPAETAAFLRLSDGKVLGVAKPAGTNTRFRVVTESLPPARRTTVPSPATPTATRPTTGTPGAASTGNPAPPPTTSPATSTPATTTSAPATTASATTPTGGRNFARTTSPPTTGTTADPP